MLVLILNRQVEQKVGHGGFAYLNNQFIQQRFRQLALNTEPCPVKTKLVNQYV
jgi:hypothetical protein